MNSTNKNRELRRFGLSLGLGLMVISNVLRIKGKPYIILPPLSLLIVLIAFIKPMALGIIKNLLERIFTIITTLITWILLLIVFYLIITPLGLIARLFRKRFLKIGFEDIPSYFEKRDMNKLSREAYESQF